MESSRPNVWIILLTSLLLILFMIPVTGLLITPDDTPQPLNTPIFDLNNMTLEQVFYIENETQFFTLGNLSLIELFEESTIPALSNLVTNGDFSGGTTGWVNRSNSSQSVTNGINTVTATANGTLIGIDKPLSYGNSSNVYYIKLRVQSQSTNTFFIGGDGVGVIIATINTWYVLNKAHIFLSNATFRLYQSLLSGQSFQIDYILMFNLTTSHGVTATSGTAYDNAVAEIEWLLSKNAGYIQSEVNWFSVLRTLGINVSVSQMDLLYNLYSTGLYNYEVYELLYDFDLTEAQWDYYYQLYLYYTSL